MPVISTPADFLVDDLYVTLEPIVGRPLFLKCEGFNFAGSIKLKAALEMVEAAESSGALRPGDTLVESSSGNMGIALSLVAASHGYRLICVTDSRCTATARRLIEAFGGEIHLITEPDRTGGFLGARIDYVKRLCAENDGYVWLNQYTNAGNWQAHYRTTAPSIAKQFPELDVLFVGAGTTGTAMGCARYFRENNPGVRIVAIDSVGSVTFGGPPGPRMIPGLGTSVRPAMLDETVLDDIVLVTEQDAIRACHRLAQHGFLFGGSTGTVVSGAMRWLEDHGIDAGCTTVAISPDMGERYLDTVYREAWVRETFGADVLDGVPPRSATPATATRSLQ